MFATKEEKKKLTFFRPSECLKIHRKKNFVVCPRKSFINLKSSPNIPLQPLSPKKSCDTEIQVLSGKIMRLSDGFLMQTPNSNPKLTWVVNPKIMPSLSADFILTTIRKICQ
jgi:hypothetical protein